MRTRAHPSFGVGAELGYDYAKGKARVATTQTVIDWSLCPVLESKPDTQGGAWVFRGTRVPVGAILRNLGELSAAELVEEFPTVRPEQIAEFLDFLARSAAQHS